VESIQAKGYRYDGIRAEPLKGSNGTSPVQKRIQSVPIRLRGRTIGTLKIMLAEGSTQWTEDDRAIAEAAAERAALALEGARLLEEAKRRAAREAFLSEMAAKLGTSFRLDSILRDTVEELGRTLENSTVTFQLIDPSGKPCVRPWDETPVKPRDSE
jgi:GAF domain-containing protein